jgi:transketolase
MTQTVARTEFDCRVAFAETLIELAAEDRRIVVVCNDSVGSSNLVRFKERYPDRLVNVGIAEQDMVGVAAGLANTGLVPFVCAASPFLTSRALEQIKADVAYSGYHVVLCGMSPGVAYGELGPTHHSIEDLSWLRAIAELDIVVPADPEQTRQVVRWAASTGRGAFLRIGRLKVPAVSRPDSQFRLGHADIMRDGDDLAVIAAGSMVSRALDAADLLHRDGIQARVVNMATIAPLDEAAVFAAAATGAVITIEEATVTGGLGSAVASLIVQKDPVPMRILGIQRQFAPTGAGGFLLEYFGLTAEAITRAAFDLLGRVRTGM